MVRSSNALYMLLEEDLEKATSSSWSIFLLDDDTHMVISTELDCSFSIGSFGEMEYHEIYKYISKTIKEHNVEWFV